MKTFITVIICICTVAISNAQNIKLKGDWNIIEFTIINNDVNNTRSELDLKEEKAIWDLFFMEENQFKQLSNMRTGQTESHVGSWNVAENQLTLGLVVNNNDIQLKYTYKIENDVLVLNRNNPSGTFKIIAKFRRRL